MRPRDRFGLATPALILFLKFYKLSKTHLWTYFNRNLKKSWFWSWKFAIFEKYFFVNFLIKMQGIFSRIGRHLKLLSFFLNLRLYSEHRAAWSNHGRPLQFPMVFGQTMVNHKIRGWRGQNLMNWNRSSKTHQINQLFMDINEFCLNVLIDLYVSTFLIFPINHKLWKIKIHNIFRNWLIKCRKKCYLNLFRILPNDKLLNQWKL